MQNFWVRLSLALLLSFSIGTTVTVHAQSPSENPSKTTIQLTGKQKRELAALHKEILQKKKALISKYIEYGLISEKRGQRLIAHIDRHYARMEKEGFVPKWHKPMKRHCRPLRQSR
ncbi:MAG TPA: YckD family protein [Bacillales bacterium]|nr:YckD family protein [Bacillales bacterium]